MSSEREKAILQILIQKKAVSVSELAKRLYVSEPSIRRDLHRLETQRLLKRTHGGAVLEANGISPIKFPFILRELESSDAKIQIARRAAALIPDESVVFLDASTSAYRLIPFLAEKRDMTVITNGVKALTDLSECAVRTISTGGTLVASCMSLIGEDAIRTIRCYHADFCFFSCRGVSEKGELTDISAEEDYIRQEMIARSEKSYLLSAGDKFGKRFYHHLCTVEELTGVISDIILPPSFRPLPNR